MKKPYVSLRNCEAAKVRGIPVLHADEFRQLIIELCNAGGCRVASFFGTPWKNALRLFAVLASDREGLFHVFSSDVKETFESITPECPQAQAFEREIAEQWGVKINAHPWFKPLRFHPSFIDGADAWGRDNVSRAEPSVTDFYKIDGDAIHEVAVGPVHAGVIEPGHFRFQCLGEQVYHLEISLGYQHRGIEKALVGTGPSGKTIHFIETAAGDTSVGHSSAYSRLVETLSGTPAPPAAEAVRGIALELERLANHTGDLGALANDVAFLPTSSFCGRIRGDYLNMTALVCGNRFGRNLVRPGGTAFDLDAPRRDALGKKIDEVFKDTQGAVNLLWQSPSVMGRFEDTGVLDKDLCRALGCVGPTARACGMGVDSRFDFPQGIYRFSHIPVSTWNSGDVFARAYVRWLEIQRSRQFISETLEAFPEGGCMNEERGALAPGSFIVSSVEGWRGEIVHVAITDNEGKFARYKIVDPSFHNWSALAMVMRDEQISNFPLCNKSFNLSYCGHDL